MLQPEFDSQMAERLHKARQLLQANRQKIHNGTSGWLAAEAQAREALREAESQGLEPSNRIYDGESELPRSTAADEMRFILRELGQNPETTVSKVRDESAT